MSLTDLSLLAHCYGRKRSENYKYVHHPTQTHVIVIFANLLMYVSMSRKHVRTTNDVITTKC